MNADASTAHETMTWLPAIQRYASVSDMRDALAARHPTLAPGRLRELAIVGAAGEGRRLAALCEEHAIAVRAVADDDPAKQGMRIASAAVVPTAGLAALDRSIPVVIASHRVLRAAAGPRRLGFANVAPFAALQVLRPERFPPHMFYAGLLEDLFAHRARYAALAARLYDDGSRAVLDAVLGFRLTLDAELLRAVVDESLYFAAGLLTYGPGTVYVDAGAFDGDSIRAFIDRAGGRFGRVLAFEPDPATFRRLAENFADESRVQAFPMGLHRQGGVLHFMSDASRGARLVDQGGAPVPVAALDDVLQGGPVDVVKMNIEGAEIDALVGAAASIRRWAPALLIATYHRPSDLWRVPETVEEIRSGYRLFLRQHDGGIIETVLYALP
ncbi:MAG TPA: FkbM family methyltransferase [bacterium]|nr:FkbM family methyltransferase [bacterium]